MIIGLTGGIGSGKSTVAAILQQNGYQIIDADAISREVTAAGAPALQELAAEFGEDILQSDGSLNRKLLAERAFSSPEKTDLLNRIITNKVIELSKSRFTEKCVYDAPTLLENGLEHLVDLVMVVTADREKRIRRVMERDGRTPYEIEKIISSQMPEEEKIRRADVVIYNNGSLEELIKSVTDAINCATIEC